MGRTAKGNTDEQEIGEARNFGLPDMLYDVAARVATTRVGQFAYKRVDNLLWTVEKTARWSLPQSFPAEVGLAATRASAPAGGDDEDLKAGNISGPPLVRPLPWLLFLPALILLRMIRTTLSVATLAIGRGPVLPSAMVGFLQNKRRKLRALKYRGQRLQRIRKVEREVGAGGGQQRASWLERFRTLEPLRMLFCSSRPYVDANSDVAHAIVFRKDRPAQPKRATAKKRSLNQREADSDGETGSDSCEDANCQELLEKYAHVADDSSFNVEDVTSASDTTDSCASDVEPSPKKNNVETGSAAEQHQQNGGQHKGQNSKSDLESPAAKADEPSKVPPSKSMDAANRSKSATGLENSSAATATSSDAKLTSSSSTPSKSIPNLSSSPENNENKPLNQNVPGKSSSSSSPQSGRKMVAPVTKQSPSAPQQADGGRSNAHQQHHKPARSQPVATTTQQQQQPQQQPSQQYFSNGGKNRPKKPTNQSVA